MVMINVHADMTSAVILLSTHNIGFDEDNYLPIISTEHPQHRF